MLAVLEELRFLGVQVVADGGNLVISPASKVPMELKERLRAAKPEILEVLRSRPATCGPTCYEIEPGRWIHHPWDGCKTPVSPKTANPIPQAGCKHCGGHGMCGCPACSLRRTSEPTPCSMCRWEDHRLWLAATRPRECWHCEERRRHGEVGLCSNCEAKPVAVQ
jgi:hypothetical protein